MKRMTSGNMEENRKPDCKLTEENGNVFNLIGLARKALIENGQRERADEMRDRIIKKGEAHSYDEALQIIMEYVNVK